VAIVVAVAMALTACAPGGSDDSAVPAGDPGDDRLSVDTVRLGYFPNVTHAAAVLGVQNGTFAEALGGTALESSTFNAGPAAMEALLSGAIDVAFIGPNPAVNAYVKSDGDALRIVAGANNNGAALVVGPGIDEPDDLRGRTLATPQFGGTQDIALRKWLLDNGLTTLSTGGDDVDIINQQNSLTLNMFRSGEIAGGWLPEPWASRLALEVGGKVLVDETSLWPDGQFPTTVLISSRQFLADHPDVIEALITAEVAEIEAVIADPDQARISLNAAIGELTGKPLQVATMAMAFANVRPTWDPLPTTLTALAANAVEAGGLAEVPDLAGIYDLRVLNKVLLAAGHPPIGAAGLGQE
jgi:NitT/TauT family transport system substrate-binding protein